MIVTCIDRIIYDDGAPMWPHVISYEFCRMCVVVFRSRNSLQATGAGENHVICLGATYGIDAIDRPPKGTVRKTSCNGAPRPTTPLLVGRRPLNTFINVSCRSLRRQSSFIRKPTHSRLQPSVVEAHHVVDIAYRVIDCNSTCSSL